MHARREFLHRLGLAGAAAGLAGCAPGRALDVLTPRDTYRATTDVAYGPRPRQRLDLYRPAGDAPAGGFPTVLFFYGGSWNSGARADYRFVGEALASRGMLAAVADYRLYPEVSYPAFLDDCALALAWLLGAAPRLDGDGRRVFVMGHSAGAYNAAMLALDTRWLAALGSSPRRLAGWIGLAGPYDFLPIRNPQVQPVFHHPQVPPDSQPIAYADQHGIPCFLGMADNDSLVDPRRNSEQLARRLEQAGTAVTLRLYDGLTHVTLAGALARPLRWLAPVLDDVDAFVRRTPPA